MPPAASFPRARPRTLLTFAAPLILIAFACSSGDPDNPNPTGGAGSGGGTGGTGGSGGVGGGSTAECPQVLSMLDVSKAPGAGDAYAKPTLSATCTDTTFIVDSNGIPHYTFIPITPNPLVEQPGHYEIPRNPVVAAASTPLAQLGGVGFAVNGLPLFTPSEGPQPAQQAFGDPVYNGIMDPCMGHTADRYHYHALEEKCMRPSGLVSEPWKNPDPPANEASPIVGWALDGFPIYGPMECADAECASVIEIQSGYEKIGDPTTNAWDAYAWKEHAGDPAFLDECNGHVGPEGDYHYHATAGFPYIIGCYKGTVNGGGMGGMGGAGGAGGAGGGGMGGPKSCTDASECAGACPQGSMGCTCAQSPMGMICVPTCQKNADCPPGPMGGQLVCQNGTCVPG
jgi:hypothetical protein